MSDTVAEKLVPSPAPADMARDLENLIVDGVFAAGKRLTEREVTERYSCTYSTARDVLHFLEWYGVVRLSSRRGARVVGPVEIPPDHALAVWCRLYSLMLDEVRRRQGDIPTYNAKSAVEEGMSCRLAAVRCRLEMLAEISLNSRLGDLLALAAVHIVVVAPERFGQVEASLAA